MAWIPELGSVRNRQINYNFQPGITENYINPLVSAMQARQMMELSAERKRQQQLEDAKRQQLQGIGEQYGTTPDLKKLGASLISSGEVGAGLSAITQDRLERKEFITDPKIAKFNKDLASVMMPLKDDPIAWEKARMELDSTNSFIPAFDDASKQGWLNFAQMKDPDKNMSITDILKLAESTASNPKAYRDLYNNLSVEERKNILNPDLYSQEEIKQAYPEGALKSMTLSSELAQKELKGKEATEGLGQFTEIPAEKSPYGVDIYKNIPEMYRSDASEIKRYYEGRIKPSREAVQNSKTLLNFLTNKDGTPKEKVSGYDAVSTVFLFMKTLDPSSVVREGEYATVTGEGGLWNKLQAYINSAEAGTNFTPQQIAQFADTVRLLQDSYSRNIDEADYSASEQMLNYGLDPKFIIGNKKASEIAKQFKNINAIQSGVQPKASWVQ